MFEDISQKGKLTKSFDCEYKLNNDPTNKYLCI